MQKHESNCTYLKIITRIETKKQKKKHSNVHTTQCKFGVYNMTTCYIHKLHKKDIRIHTQTVGIDNKYIWYSMMTENRKKKKYECLDFDIIPYK